MSNLVITKKRKLKDFQPVELDKKDSNSSPTADSEIKAGKSIQIDKETLTEYEKATQTTANKKVIYNAKSFISGSDEADSEDYRRRVPFELKKDSTGVDFENTKTGIQIINNHLDDEAMQSPWVSEYVGGSQHRRNKFNSDSERIEAYEIVENDRGLIIQQPTNKPGNYRRSPGSPCYNVGNHKAGNYTSDYEIVITTGRDTNNKHLIASGSSFLEEKPVVSSYVSGFFDYQNIERKKSSHIIVNRFSSPGGPETNGSFGSDRESGEYSIYNSLNYRNRNVRDVVDGLSSESSKQFGLSQDGSSQGSYHKIHRNTRRFIGEDGNQKQDDNLFISHNVPSNDFGYLWISRSAEDGVYDFLQKNSNFPYQHKAGNYGNVESESTIGFLSQSFEDQNLTFSRLNSVTRYELDKSENLITYTSGNLNQHLLNAYGPYGFSTWVQIRNAQNPITREQRKNNEISIVSKGDVGNSFVSPGSEFNYSNTKQNNNTIKQSRKVVSYKEPALSTRFYPIKASLHFYENNIVGNEIPQLVPQNTLKNIWDEETPFHSMMIQKTADNIVTDATTITLKATVQGNLSRFANEDLIDVLKDKETNFFQDENLQKVNIFFAETDNFDSQKVVRQLSYTETLYPKESTSYTKKSLDRPYYKFFGWNESRAERSLITEGNIEYSNFLTNNEEQRVFLTSSYINEEDNFEKSFFNSYEKVDVNATGSSANILSASFITSSTWVLDGRSDFSATPLNITASFFTQQEEFLENRDQGTRGEGILQNDYSIFPLGYNGLRGAPPFAPVFNRRIPQTYNSEVYLAGEAVWEATGSDSFGPFYENYADFSKDLKFLSRGYSLVPEFLMSDIIEDIYKSQNPDKAATPSSFLHLTGTDYKTSTAKSDNLTFFKNFSNSEFMKYFRPLVDNVDQANLGVKPGRLTLRCQANLKLLPYRGFYPAERAVQITEIFHKNYLNEDSYLAKYIPNDAITKSQAESYLNLRIQNAKSQVSKPLFSPGVLFNSIKTGAAVDYPIFSSSIEAAIDYIVENNASSSIQTFDNLGLGSTTCFTGSEINATTDSGIPRIKGSVSRRINIDDLVSPERLVDEVIYDNEPHPSASFLYGSAEWIRVLNRPAIFGTLDKTEVKEKNAIDFSISKESFANALRPYKNAINNFTSETISFFLEDQKLQTHVSDAISPYLKSGVEYKMRVYVNNQDTVMYDRHSAFGPPVDDGSPSKTTYLASSSYSNGAVASGAVIFSGLTRTSIDSSTLRLRDYDGLTKDYIFNNGASASGTSAQATIDIYIAGTGFHDSTLTIQNATDKSPITYRFINDNYTNGSTGDRIMANQYTAIVIDSSMDHDDVAAEAMYAITGSHGNGHGSSITAAWDTSTRKITLTQATAGTSGNNTIIGSGLFKPSRNRTSGFSGGTDTTTLSTGQLNSSNQVVVQVSSATTEQALASSLQQALNSSNGHAGTIQSSLFSDRLKLFQNTTGSLGNRTISGTGDMTGGAIIGFSGGQNQEGISFLTQSVVAESGSHGFLPYISPFLDPGTRPYAEISFTPGESSNYSIPTIIENATVTYYNLTAPASSQNTTNYLNAMSLSASIDLKKYVSLYSDNFTLQEDGTRIAKKESKKYRWVIQPKWETPVLDFSEARVSALNLSNNEVNHVTGSPWKERETSNYYEKLTKTDIPYLTASTGIWHQSGNVLAAEEFKGYYLTIESGEEDSSNNKGDLASELGFISKEAKDDKAMNSKRIVSKKMGAIAKERQISESVVAIPYYTSNDGKINLFDINKNELAKARSYNNKITNSFFYNLQNAQSKDELIEIEKDYEDWSNSVGHDSVSSISYQLRMMEKYVLPPHFDFIKSESINPHVMYFFQFKSKLNESDLARIWQNLYPRSSSGPGNLKTSKLSKDQRESDIQYITGFLDTSIFPEELGIKSNYEEYERFLDNNVRWFVFKVKYRSENELSKMRNESIPRFKQDLESVNGVLLKQPLSTSVTEKEEEKLFSKFSYNWPYDYFSLVESIKMEGKVDFYSDIISPADEEEAPEQPLTSRIDDGEEQGEASVESETRVIISEDTTSTVSPLSNLVIRQEVKSDQDSAPTPANTLSIAVAAGYDLKTNSESIYVNGVLQVAGSSMDYTMSGNVITFSYDIQDGDSVYVTYIRE